MFELHETTKCKTLLTPGYNYTFSKETGYFTRWGATPHQDVPFSPLGPEILDIEISQGGQCQGKCEFCSPAKTLINTPNGNIPIAKIKKDDLVLGYDIKNKKLTINKIEETYTREYSGDLICFDLENGQTLKLTPEHVVILKNGIEKQAKDVSEDDDIIFF